MYLFYDYVYILNFIIPIFQIDKLFILHIINENQTISP